MLKKIFLTGSAGFLGKHIREHFLGRYETISPTRKELDLTHAGSVDAYFSHLKDIDCIFHAANVGGSKNSLNSESSTLFENLQSFRNVFQNASHVNRFIQFGSGAEYAKPFTKKNVCEADAGITLPKDAYGLSKFFAGQLLEQQMPGKFVNLRIFSVFGPFEDYRIRFISNAIVRSLLDLPIVVNQNALFDYVYIHDFLKILDYFIKNPAPQISYNITTGTPVTLVELAEIVHELTNNRYNLIVKNVDIKENYTGDNTRLKSLLPGDFKFTPIKVAIAELIQWYGRHLSKSNSDELMAITLGVSL